MPFHLVNIFKRLAREGDVREGDGKTREDKRATSEKSLATYM